MSFEQNAENYNKGYNDARKEGIAMCDAYKSKVKEVLGRIGNQRYCTECGKRMKEHHYCDACKQSVSVAKDGITYYAQLEIFEELGFVKELIL